MDATFPRQAIDPDWNSVQIHERGVIYLDAAGVIRHANARMADILGSNARDLIGKDYRDVCKACLQPRMREGAEFISRVEAVRQQCDKTIEDVLVIIEGDSETTYHRYSSPMLDIDGALAGRVEVYSDITFRRQLEQMISERTNELAILNDQLQHAQESLVHTAKLAALGEMSAGVAHNLNNVLGVILGNVQLALRKDLEPDLREKLEACELSAADGAKTVQRIRALAKSEEQVAFEPVDLGAIVREVVGLIKPNWRSDAHLGAVDIQLVTDLADPLTVMGSSADLREVAANIILNAVQAMPGGGVITVRAREEDGAAALTIADTGIGMSEDTKRRVFDPFFTTRGREGTGLGLSIADAVISKHGGLITVESELGKGTEMIIRLPLAQIREESPKPAEPTHRVKRHAEAIVVDDDKMFGKVIGQMLEEQGHSVMVFTTGSEALEQIKTGPCDILITDLAMPEMKGTDLAKAARRIVPNLSVILLTGFASAADSPEIAASGIKVVLPKPVDHDQLMQAISDALDEGRA